MKAPYDDRYNESMIKIKTIEIKEFKDIFQLITEQPIDTETNRNRSPYFYRGLPNVSYHLQTSLQRNCGEKRADLEKCLLRNFAKYAMETEHGARIATNDWTKMIIGQHHGLPTRLMDWSYSPLVALHFALSESNPADYGNHDCAVWKINCVDLINTLPDKYTRKLGTPQRTAYLYTVDMLSEITLQEYDDDMEKQESLLLLEPPSIDQRIVNQYSYFTVIPSYMDCVEEFIAKKLQDNTVRYVIDKSLRWRIRDMLDQMNINERIMLPGLDGLATWLKRYYYVKETI